MSVVARWSDICGPSFPSLRQVDGMAGTRGRLHRNTHVTDAQTDSPPGNGAGQSLNGVSKCSQTYVPPQRRVSCPQMLRGNIISHLLAVENRHPPFSRELPKLPFVEISCGSLSFSCVRIDLFVTPKKKVDNSGIQ